MKQCAWLGMTLLAAGLGAGCVERRYTIYSDPPGAIVYRNGVYLGPTPVDDHFVYYGQYKFTLVKEGYETLEVEQKIGTPWYELPGVDFVTENLVPYRIRDVRVFNYCLQPLKAVAPDQVLGRAVELRARGQAIPTRAPAPSPVPAPAAPGGPDAATEPSGPAEGRGDPLSPPPLEPPASAAGPARPSGP